MRVPGSLVRVFEAEGSHDGFRYGTLVLLGSSSSFVQRLELALNGAGAPVVLTFRNGGANQKKARGWEFAHGAGKNGYTQTMLTSFPRNRFPVHSPRE